MKVEFHDSYFLFVLAGLWVLCFLRPLLRCAAQCVEGGAKCVEEGCECECCDECGGCGLLGQNALLLVLFAQPVVIGGVGVWAHAQEDAQRDSPIFLVQFERWEWPRVGKPLDDGKNASALVEQTHKARLLHEMLDESTVELSHTVYAVDYLFFALPFAFAVSVSSVLLVHLLQARILSEHSTWDDGLDADLMLYEGAYAVELYMMNLSLFAASSSARPLSSLLYGTGVLTLIELYFVAIARYPRSSMVEHNISTLFLLALCVAGSSLWSNLADYACAATGTVASAHIMLTGFLVLLHFSAQGILSARAVVRTRLASSAAACALHVGVLATGRSAWCSP